MQNSPTHTTVTNGSKDAKAAVIDSFPCCTNPRKSLADEYSSLVNEAQNLINEVHLNKKRLDNFSIWKSYPSVESYKKLSNFIINCSTVFSVYKTP
jgi:predicted transcriptional regulator